MPNTIVVGLGWGDEGKGKIIDLLSKDASRIVRAQGGNNAGHTIHIGHDEFFCHLVPSGILYPHTRCYLGAGMVIDPKGLLEELHVLQSKGVEYRGRFFISPYAHLVLPYHRTSDAVEEQAKKDAIGTTGRGIGPCYADKANRIGIRMGDLVDFTRFERLLRRNVAIKNREREKLYGEPGYDVEAIIAEYKNYSGLLSPYIINVEQEIAAAAVAQENLLFEGAQGALLDLTFGTYPFVTSSCTLSSGCCSGAGIGPSRIDKVVGVIKAYTTRVGNGPFPTKLSDGEMALFPDNKASREIGVTTGRLRQIGWFDAVLGRFAVEVNGVDAICLTKLDILDRLDTIKICTGYLVNGAPVQGVPFDLSQAHPVYEEMPGWKESTVHIRHFTDLPQKARNYVKRLQELCHAPIELVSVGPQRDSVIWVGQ